MKLAQLLEEYRKYPLTLRVAAKLHLEGWTDNEVHKFILTNEKYKGRYKGISEADVIGIYNDFRGLKLGVPKLDARLTDLAKNLDIDLTEISI